MGLIQSIKDTWESVKFIRNHQRNLNKLTELLSGSKSVNSEPDFFDISRSPGYFSTAGSVFGVTDETVSPQDIYDMIHKDPYFAGLFEQLIESLFNNGFYIQRAKDHNGVSLGSIRQAKHYEAQLRNMGFMEMMQRNVYAKRADGGGNGLFFTVKKPQGVEFKFEPFLDLGQARVRVVPDYRNRVINKYEIIDGNRQVVYAIDPKKMYSYHSRYSQGGDFRFSSGPAKRAVYWFVLKKYIAGSNLASFKKGLQKPVIGSPKYEALTALVNAMSTNKVGSEVKQEYLKDPIKFLAKQSELDDEILRGIAGDARQTNSFLKLKMPYDFQVIDRTNKDMQTIEMIALCDEQMGYALRTSKGVINTKDSKYVNAEIEKDNWSEMVLDAEKRACEQLAKDFFLPVIDPDYNPDVYVPRVGRDPDQEDLDLWEAKTTRNESIGRNLQIASGLPNWDFDPDLNEWVKTSTADVDKELEQPHETAINQKEESREVKLLTDLYIRSDLTVYAPFIKPLFSKEYHRNLEESFANKKIKQGDYQKLRSLIEKVSRSQLEIYVSKLNKKSNLSLAIQNLGRDFPKLTSVGLPVSTLKKQLLKFARSGIEEFEESDGTKVLFRAEFDFDYPSEVLNLIDAKSQLLLKGYNSLSGEQKGLIDKYFGDYKAYKGIDEETSSQINTILKDMLDAGPDGSGKVPGVMEASERIKEKIDTLSGFQATRIAVTEANQATAATRDLLYTRAGYDEHNWNTVKDKRVRKRHADNEAQGWIPIDQAFQSGEHSPAEAIMCRCDKGYRRKVGS